MKWYQSIRVKIVLSVVATAILVNVFFIRNLLQIQEQHLNETILRTASLLSKTVENSLTSEMLGQNAPAAEGIVIHAYRVVDTIAAQEGVEQIRIYNGLGQIVSSSKQDEVGRVADKGSEACRSCHDGASPPKAASGAPRTRIYTSDGGHRVLEMIHPLYNERKCYTAECHFHSESMKVLGVVDLRMSLENVDGILQEARSRVVSFNLMSIAAISSILVVVLLVVIGRPVAQLLRGTQWVAEGELEHVIPVTAEDEIGQLARSFNRMTEHLRDANAEIQTWIQNLESMVDERTAELKSAQERLLQTEKMVAIGRIAATVAHEINNPLTGVYTYIKLMERKISGGGTGREEVAMYREYLSTMGREVERTTAIVSNLLDLTRPKDPVRKPVDIGRVIGESLAIIQNQLKISNVTVERSLCHVPEFLADPAQMKQVFINLFVNASDAMERGGVLSIRSSHDAAKGKVTVEVGDTGNGIPKENLSRIFDPFFTTKGKGTGLGLSVVKGVVERHGGTIGIESAVGRGTQVRIVLPAV